MLAVARDDSTPSGDVLPGPVGARVDVRLLGPWRRRRSATRGATFTTGEAGSVAFTSTGFPVPKLPDGSAALPAGVSFVDNGDGTATLSGSPAPGTEGVYPFTITASNGTSPDATRSFTVTVLAAPTVPPSNPSSSAPVPSVPTASISNPTSGPVILPSNQFTVSDVRTFANSTITFAVRVPGPGTIDVLDTAWNDDMAHVAVGLEPALHRFVFARARVTTNCGGVLHLRVTPNARGRQLVRHHTYRVTLRLWASYTPTGGA